jgi:phosphonate transport system substrate-binding protein
VNFLPFRSNSRPVFSLALLFILGLLLVMAASACGGDVPVQATGTPTLTLTATFPPTLTPTPIPLGEPENPFVIGLVSEVEDPQMIAAADEIARQVSELSGENVSGLVYPSYPALIQAMERGNVHISWLPPLTYIYASRRGIAEVALLTNHFGVYQYGTQYLANIESGFTPYFDPISGMSSENAEIALAQFQDMRPCWVDPQSASGYIVPAGLLALNEIPILPAVISQSHTAVVRGLYVRGICDFGATFSISGDPRTASGVQLDLPDVLNRVYIIWRSDAIIPNLNLSFLAGFTEADRQKMVNAFLALGQSPEGRSLMSLSAGNYQIEEVRTVNDDLYDPLRDTVEVLNLDLSEMIGK